MSVQRAENIPLNGPAYAPLTSCVEIYISLNSIKPRVIGTAKNDYWACGRWTQEDGDKERITIHFATLDLKNYGRIIKLRSNQILEYIYLGKYERIYGIWRGRTGQVTGILRMGCLGIVQQLGRPVHSLEASKAHQLWDSSVLEVGTKTRCSGEKGLNGMDHLGRRGKRCSAPPRGD